MFYIYTLVMAGYCTVLSTVYTKCGAAVQAVHPIV